MPQSELFGSEPAIASDLFTSGFSRDPNPTYARLRAEPNLSGDLATVRLFLHHEIRRRRPVGRGHRPTERQAALSDPRLSKDLYGPGEKYRQIFGPNSAALNKNMLHSDPPEHTRLQRLVSQAFTPRRVEALRPRTAEVVEGLVDASRRAAQPT